MRFKFEGEGGNNFFLDDINLYSGGPSNELVVAALNETVFTDLNVYPNPTDGDLHLQFTATCGGKGKLQITELSGKVLATYPLHVQAGSNLVLTDTKQFAAGSYLLELEFNGTKTIRTFVVK